MSSGATTAIRASAGSSARSSSSSGPASCRLDVAADIRPWYRHPPRRSERRWSASSKTMQSSADTIGRVVALEVVAEPLVVVEPPEGRAGQQQILAAARAHVLEDRDRRVAVLRVVARVAPELVLGEVQRAPRADAQQLLVPAAHHQHGRVARDHRVGGFPHALYQTLVLVGQQRRRLGRRTSLTCAHVSLLRHPPTPLHLSLPPVVRRSARLHDRWRRPRARTRKRSAPRPARRREPRETPRRARASARWTAGDPSLAVPLDQLGIRGRARQVGTSSDASASTRSTVPPPASTPRNVSSDASVSCGRSAMSS